jgi:hypothetical protein
MLNTDSTKDSTKDDCCLISVYNLPIFVIEKHFETPSLVSKIQFMENVDRTHL